MFVAWFRAVLYIFQSVFDFEFRNFRWSLSLWFIATLTPVLSQGAGLPLTRLLISGASRLIVSDKICWRLSQALSGLRVLYYIQCPSLQPFKFCTYISLDVIFIVSAFNRSWIEFDIFSLLIHLITLWLPREGIMELAFITLYGRLVSVTSIRVGESFAILVAVLIICL